MIHNIAHRGASAYEPENTLRAFERAIEMGATMIELDIYLSRDGYPVVTHDADLMRVAHDPRQIGELTLHQLRQFDMGKGETIPTLDDAIEVVRGRAELYIELKGANTATPVVAALRAAHFNDEAIVGSFHADLIRQAKAIAPTLRTSWLIGEQGLHRDFIAPTLALHADYVHLCWERLSPTPHLLLTAALLTAIRRRGLGIILWHEERPSELRQLVRMDVDGICTNTPDILTAILGGQLH